MKICKLCKRELPEPNIKLTREGVRDGEAEYRLDIAGTSSLWFITSELEEIIRLFKKLQHSKKSRGKQE
jgi:hypothetical protein